MKRLYYFYNKYKKYRLEISECQMEYASFEGIKVRGGIEVAYTLKLNTLLDSEGRNREAMKFINFVVRDIVFKNTRRFNEGLIETVRLELIRKFIARNIIKL